jgi:hypothetical protein
MKQNYRKKFGLLTHTAAAVQASVAGLVFGALAPRSPFSVPGPRSDPWHEHKLDAEEVISISEGRGGLYVWLAIQKLARPRIFSHYTQGKNVDFIYLSS